MPTADRRESRAWTLADESALLWSSSGLCPEAVLGGGPHVRPDRVPGPCFEIPEPPALGHRRRGFRIADRAKARGRKRPGRVSDEHVVSVARLVPVRTERRRHDRALLAEGMRDLAARACA